MDTSAQPMSSSGDAPATPATDSQTSASPATDKEASRDGDKTESETKAESKAEAQTEIKTEMKEEETNGGKEGENGGVKQEDKKDVKMSADGIPREEGDTQEVRYRNFKVFLLNDSCKTTAQRAKIIGML